MDNDIFVRINLEANKVICNFLFIVFLSIVFLLVVNIVSYSAQVEFYFILASSVPFAVLLSVLSDLAMRPNRYLIVRIRDCGNVVHYYEGKNTFLKVLQVKIVSKGIIIITKYESKLISLPFWINKNEIEFKINSALSFVSSDY